MSIGSSRPANAQVERGWIHFDTGSNVFEFFTGSVWTGALKTTTILGQQSRSILCNPSTTPAVVSEYQLSDRSILCRPASSDLTEITASSNNMVVMRGVSSVNDLNFRNTRQLIRSMIDDDGIAKSGSFPSGAGFPHDGAPCYRTDHGMAYHYDASHGGWVSDTEWIITGGFDGSLSATNGLDYNRGGSVSNYADVGFSFPFPVIPTFISAWCEGSSTCEFSVRDDGTTITGATLSYSGTGWQSTDWHSTSFTEVSADSDLTLWVTSGTATTSCSVNVGFRRFES